ncbi:MAG: Cof-type HAD-IIB family hydrolase [Actinomycetia bacterium]|nr:Cof-type HAD-IIB family hydrolase [Actinomycetes bacterium]
MTEIKFFKQHQQQIKRRLTGLKVIYTDLDGTLLNDKGSLLKDSNGRFYLGAVEGIHKLQQRGIDLVLVSGRNKTQLRYNAQMMGLKNYIAELGSELVYELGKEVRVTFDDSHIDYDITYGGKDLKKIIRLLKKNFPHKIEGKMEWSRYRSYNALFFGEIDLARANQLLRENGYGNLALVENGKSGLVDLDLEVKDLYIYNLMPRGVSKAKAIALDKKVRKIETGQCIALGDSPADIDMASEVEYFFLMGDSLKKDGDFIHKLAKYDNILVTNGEMNRGWTEVISYLLE